MKVNNRNLLNILIYIYLMLPTLIFVVGWMKWYFAFAFGILIAIACVRGFSDSIQDKCLILSMPADSKTFLKALLLIVLWVYLSGIGGWCYQNSDHGIRNSIFRALVEYDWPVISHDGSRGLIYYIGFWLPAACVGKIFGLEAGYTAQVIWAVLGIFIVYYLICVYRKKVDLLPIAFLIFFSGLDCVGTWLLGKEGFDLRLAEHLEWWAYDIQFTSTTSQLFWVFNQAIPAWVSTMLIMTQKNCKNMLFILSLTMLSSTIPFIGLIPIVLYLYVKRVKADRSCWKEVFTLQNIVGVVVIGGTVFLYLIGNASGNMIGWENAGLTAAEPGVQWVKYLVFFFLAAGIFVFFVCRYRRVKADGNCGKEVFTLQNIAVVIGCGVFLYLIGKVSGGMTGRENAALTATEPAAQWVKYLLFYFLEFGIYLLFVCKYRKKDSMVYLLTAILVICPFIKVGYDYDFCMRASIPALFILMLLCMETLEKIYLDGKKGLLAVYCVVLMLGAVTAFNEINRSIYVTFWRAIDGKSVRYQECSIDSELLRIDNFSGEIHSNLFFNYFANVYKVFTE